MKTKVLIMTAYYTPAVKGGGPIQSIRNLVNNLSDKIDFYIITSDRDVNEAQPFTKITTDRWLEVEKAKVFYTDTSTLTFKKMKSILNSIDCDVIYLNSIFSYKFSIMPILLRRFNRIPQKSIIIAPRGELSEGALGLKKAKKKIYLNFAKALGLYENIKWHATAETERANIIKVFGSTAQINVISNLTDNYADTIYDKDIKKEKGQLKLLFISRIHPKKNLKKAIEFLHGVEGKVEFNIYGPIEDNIYWSECKKMIDRLPKNIKVLYKGVVNHDSILEIFRQHHVFLFPTLGENYGHVISEAFIGGCPVIISDQTPWTGLQEKNVGWDISLTSDKRFTDVVQYCINLNETEYRYMSLKAFQYGKANSNQKDNIKLYTDLYDLRI